GVSGNAVGRLALHARDGDGRAGHGRAGGVVDGAGDAAVHGLCGGRHGPRDDGYDGHQGQETRRRPEQTPRVAQNGTHTSPLCCIVPSGTWKEATRIVKAGRVDGTKNTRWLPMERGGSYCRVSGPSSALLPVSRPAPNLLIGQFSTRPAFNSASAWRASGSAGAIRRACSICSTASRRKPRAARARPRL